MHGEEMSKKGKKDPLIQITVKVDAAFIERLDALAPIVSKESGGIATRAQIMRAVMLKGIASYERKSAD